MIYYAETNLITILVAALIMLQLRRVTSKNETSSIIQNWMMRLLMIMSTCDMAAFAFRGESYLGVQIANVLYFVTMALGSYAWFLYILVKTEYTRNLKRAILMTSLPLLLLCAAILLNPVTGFFFSVDAENLYHRGPGVPVSWVVEWGYLLAALVINIRQLRRERSSYRRSEYRGYLLFVVPMALAAVCQMVFYGTTTTQVGFMLSMLMAYMNRQHYQVQRDELTELNNRNALLHFKDSLFYRGKETMLSICMMDVNYFKSINDTYGHLKGDQALKDVADAMRAAAGTIPDNRLMLYRYAGDEFVAVGVEAGPDVFARFVDALNAELERTNERNSAQGERYRLAVSVGVEHGSCSDVAQFDKLLNRADEAMYQAKKESKR